jgi:hypothetical protein
MRPLLCASVFLALPFTLAGQTGVGQIQGTVNDASGSVVPQASVTLEHLRTDIRFETKTNEVGFYVFPSLQLGDYKLTVNALGMQRWQGDIVITVGQRAVVNVALQIARAAEQITVAGDVTPLVTTTTPTVSTTLERARIEQLPLNSRQIMNLLAVTVPGLEGAASQPRVYGLRDSAMELLQDGVNLQDRNTGAIQSRPPGLDTVQEFRVETAVSSAKLNRPASVILTTRSGSNAVHGSVFLTGRNSGFGVARQRQDTFVKPPPLVRNEFGASGSGPVYIPKLYNGRNRTFFFAAWEEFRQRQYTNTGSAVWTEAMRRGDFSALADAQGRRITLYDPWSVGAGPNYTKTPYINNQLPTARLSPLAKYIFGVTPLPTAPNINPLVESNYFGPAPNHQDTRTFTFRGDHRVGDKDSLFGRYSKGLNDQVTRRAFQTGGHPITSDGYYNRETYYESSHTAMGSWTHTFSPSMFVETVGTLSRIDWQYSLNQPTAQQDISAQYGTPNPFKVNGAPYIINAGYGATQLHGIVPRRQFTKIFSIEQNYTWVRGNHQFEFGGRYRDEILDTIPDRPNQSTLSYNSFATAIYNPSTGSTWGTQAQTGDMAANFFLGIADSYSQQRPPGNYNMTSKDISLYLQDNWRIRPNLTVNIGLRYSYLGPYLDTNGVTSVFDFATRSLVRNVSTQELIDSGYTTKPIADGYANLGVKWTTPDKVGLPDSLIASNYRDFAPRLGFAYTRSVRGRSFVVRGGYGMYYFPVPARTFNGQRGNAPLQGSYAYSWNNSAQTVDGQANALLRFAPTVITGVNSANVLDISQPPTVLPGETINSLARELPTSKAHEWNLTLEYEIIKDTVVRGALIGTAGRNNEGMQQFNANPISNYVWFVASRQPLPQGLYQNTARRSYDTTIYGDINVYSKRAFSNYSGLQLEAERRLSRGLAFQFFYLMSNALSAGNIASQGGGALNNSILETSRFLPGTMPEDQDDRLRYYRYSRDTGVPKHRLRWNWIYDLPFGKGKQMLGNAGPVLNRIVGGWQIAGYATSASRYWMLPTNNWGTFGDVEIYGTKYPIEDCRSGGCFRGYLYHNGYLPAHQINVANGIQGAPSNYKPSNTPINLARPTGTVDANFNNTNNVFVQLANGANQLIAVDTGLHPWRNQAANAPWLTTWNASVFKAIPITERVSLRLNLDSFNTLNQPGIPGPGGDGIISLRTSAQGARVLQYTARISW